jgi:hypothetical protein
MVKQYKVIKTSCGGAQHDFGSEGSFVSCHSLCEQLHWVSDEGYVWDLEIVEA